MAPAGVLRILLAVLLAAQLTVTFGLLIPTRIQESRGPLETKSLARRATSPVGVVSIIDVDDVIYSVNLTVGGSLLTVQLDTGRLGGLGLEAQCVGITGNLVGSSDLVIIGNVSNSLDTNIPVNETYYSGQALGVMAFATVQLAGYTVEDQVYECVPVNGSFYPYPEYDGVLGLGPTTQSQLTKQLLLSNVSAELAPNGTGTFVERIFEQNSSLPNFMTFYLQRVYTNRSAIGTFTIGELLPGYENVTSMPTLDVINASTALHWNVLFDALLGNNGTAVPLQSSIVPGTPSGKLVATLDTGTSLAYLPSYLTDALYSHIPNATLMNISGTEAWVLPCNQEVNASFVFAGQPYPINPLDLSINPIAYGYENLPRGSCVGIYQPMYPTLETAINGATAFLRNVYKLMSWGSFVNFSSDATVQPYVQMLSLTNATEATEFFDQLYETTTASSRASRTSAESSATGLSSSTPVGTPQTPSPSSSTSGSAGSRRRNVVGESGLIYVSACVVLAIAATFPL